MEQANRDVREAIKNAKLRHWQVARAVGVDEFWFSRILRDELAPEMKSFIFAAIRKLSEAEVHQ